MSIVLRAVSASFQNIHTNRAARMHWVNIPQEVDSTVQIRKTLGFNIRKALGLPLDRPCCLERNGIIKDGVLYITPLLNFLAKDGISELRRGGFILRFIDGLREDGRGEEFKKYSVDRVARAIIGRLAAPTDDIFYSKYDFRNPAIHAQVARAIDCLMSGNIEGWNGERAQVLSRVKLIFDLSGADLSDSDITGADMRGVSLVGADLSRSVARNCDFTWADLGWSNLSYADLTGSHFDNTFIKRATVTGIQGALVRDGLQLIKP